MGTFLPKSLSYFLSHEFFQTTRISFNSSPENNVSPYVPTLVLKSSLVRV